MEHSQAGEAPGGTIIKTSSYSSMSSAENYHPPDS